MTVKECFLAVRTVGSHSGKMCVMVEFSKIGEVFSPTKLVSQIIKGFPLIKEIFLVGDIASQSNNELAFLVGDLVDLRRNVIVELDGETSLSNLSGMPSTIIVKVVLGERILSNRVDEVIYVIDSKGGDLSSATDLLLHQGKIFLITTLKENLSSLFSIACLYPQMSVCLLQQTFWRKE